MTDWRVHFPKSQQDEIKATISNAVDILRNGEPIADGAAISVYRAIDLFLEAAIIAIDINGSFVGTDRLKDLAGNDADTIVDLLNKNKEEYKKFKESF